jgi:hypothetical protein
MLEAATDPRMTPYLGKKLQNSLAYYLTMRNEMSDRYAARGGSGDLASATVAAGQERAILLATGEQLAASDPAFSTIWWMTLRSEVAPDNG